MNFNKAVLFGSIVGIAGAAAWAAIAYFANVEIGWLAWGIGLAVGVACLKGAGYGNRLVGTTAAVITLLALLLGKYATIELLVSNEFGDPEALLQESIAALDDETLTSYIADEIIDDYKQNGKNVDWPAGVDPDFASTEADYPVDVWRLADERWNALSQEDKQAWRETIEQNIEANFNANFAQFQDQIRKKGFLQSFGAIDLVFFGLALYTAFAVGQSNESSDDSESDESDSDHPIPSLS